MDQDFRTVSSPTASPSQDWGFAPHLKLQSLLSQEWVKLRTSNFARTIIGSIRIKVHGKFWRKGSVGVSRDCPFFPGTPYYLRNGKSYGFQIWPVHLEAPSEQKPIKNFPEKGACMGVSRDPIPPIFSGTGKATNFKFGQYIKRVHPNKSALKILEKRKRERIRDCWIFVGTRPLLLHISNLSSTFRGSYLCVFSLSVLALFFSNFSIPYSLFIDCGHWPALATKLWLVGGCSLESLGLSNRVRETCGPIVSAFSVCSGQRVFVWEFVYCKFLR